MRTFRYEFADYPLIHRFNARKMLNKREYISLDLGLTREKVEYVEGYVIIRRKPIDKREIERIAMDNRNNVWALIRGKLRKLLFFDGNVYKLRLVGPNTAPTLEINGIHMHRIRDVTPWEDAKMKVEMLNVKNLRVLDICTGLGYTSIWIRGFNAKEVVSIEKDEKVLMIAELNPWSKELKHVKIILGDATEVLTQMEDERFERVLHDPPRETLAKDLYSLRFYEEVYRILAKGGVLFHYVGQPGVKRGIELWKYVKRRLMRVGFRVKHIPDIRGVLAFK